MLESVSSSVQKKRKLLVLEDDPHIRGLIRASLEGVELVFVGVPTCAEARLVLQGQPDIAVILSDYRLPDGTGVDFLEYAKLQYPSATRILMTGAHFEDQNIVVEGVNKGEIFRFLPKPFSQEDLVNSVRQALEIYNLRSVNAKLLSKLTIDKAQTPLFGGDAVLAVEDIRDSGVGERLLSHAVRDAVHLCFEVVRRVDLPLYKHSLRVARLGMALADEIGLERETREKIGLASMLHDISLVGLPESLKNCQRDLEKIESPVERRKMEEHPNTSAEMAKIFPFPEVIDAIANHHEYLDASGYPRGHGGEKISLFNSIVSVADYYDEAASNDQDALQNVETRASSFFRSDAVRALTRLLRKGEFQFHHERVLLLAEIEPGMRLSTGIYTTTGMLVLKEGQVLSESLIQKLHQHNEQNTITQMIFVEADK